MLINLLVIVIIVLGALLWGSRQRGRGLFSALLNLVCVIAAGGIALSVWEPLVHGLLLNMMEDYAWCVGLVAPFVVSLVVLRLALDGCVKKNLDFDDVTNFVGGAVFGAAAGAVTAGIVVLGVSHLRTGKDLAGYTPLTYSGGSLVSTRGLWVPADRWVVSFYERLSRAGFGSDTPLADRLPRADESAAMMRVGVRGGSDTANSVGRAAVKPADVEIKGRYQVGPAPADALLTDTFTLGTDGSPIPGKFVYSDGDKPTGEVTIEGFVLNFQSGASEKSGQIVIAPGQLRLVCHNPSTGHSMGIHPAAILAKPEAGGGMYRFRMDAPEIYIPSVGGGSSAVFAPEFIVPSGYVASDLIIKSTRFELTGSAGSPALRYPTAARRDDAVRDGSLFTKFGLNVGGAGAPPRGGTRPGGPSATTPPAPTGRPATGAGTGATVVKASGSGRVEELDLSPVLPENLILNAGEIGGLELNSDRRIINGEHQFDRKAISENRGIDRQLKVDKFAATRDTAVVQLLLANSGAMSLLGRSVEAAEDILPPVLIDDKGQQYEAFGYVYSEGNRVWIRFTPGKPMRGLSELPSRISRAKRDQTARLLFRPTAGVNITAFALGGKTIATFEPPVSIPPNR